MSVNHYEKLEEPQIIELDSHLGFVLATEIDVSSLKYGLISFKGKHHSYENEEVTFEGEYIEMNYSLSHEGNISMDKTGKVMD